MMGSVLVQWYTVTAPPEPPYARIVAEIRRRIDDGELHNGDRVPSARQITREFGVALATATRVLAALRQEGLVRAVPGVGTVVEAPEPPTQRTAPPKRAASPARALDQELSKDRIVRTAIAIADEEGLAGLSMRRIAGELGTATMSLYRHVHNKDDLVLLMVDAVFGEQPPPAVRPAGWRAELELEARLQWALYQRHRWLAPVVSMTRPQLLPNGVAHTEWVLRALDGLGLDPSTTLHATVTLFGYVRGTATNFEPQAEAEQDTGVTDQEWMDEHDTAFKAFFDAGPYPMLAKLSESDIDLDLDSLFEFGLHRLLDGYAALFALVRHDGASRHGD